MLKKGLSPLIATVLLIAFAVALGAMIMNWSSGVEPTSGNSQQTTQNTGTCSDVKLELGEAFGKPVFCYADQTIKMSVLNKGTTKIAGLQVRTLDESLSEIKQDLQGSAMAQGGTFTTEIPFSKEGKIHVEIVPFLGTGVDQVYCQDKALIKDILPNC